MKKKLFLYMAILANLTLLLFTTCTTNVASGGTEVGNPKISAMLYNPGGSPAVHAKVKFFPVNYNPRVGGLTVDSTITDAQGNYSAKLDTGTYNVLASSDSGVAYQDSITVIKDSTVHPPADTLKAPGSLRGVIRLQPGDDARTVFLLFMGTNTWGTPDDSTGKFGVTNMAEGAYRVRILTTLDAYMPKDTTLSVTAGKVDSLAHDIVLQYTGIPVPSGLKITYDTLKQIVTLTWNKPTTGRVVAGYIIYRKQQDSTSFSKIKGDLVDTLYGDSTANQDKTYEYRVTAVDTNGTEGVAASASAVTIASAFQLVQRIGTIGTADGQFNNLQGIAVDSTGQIYTSEMASGSGIDRIQKFNSDGVFMMKWGTTGTNTGEFKGLRNIAIFKDTLLYAVDQRNGRIQAFDLMGNFAFSFTVGQKTGLNDPSPFSIAISDTLVYLTDIERQMIYKYSWHGDSLLAWAFPFSMDKGNAASLAVDSIGNVYLKQISSNIVVIYDPSGNLLKQFDISALNLGLANSIFIDRQQDILLTDYDRNLVWVINAAGDFIGKWSVEKPGQITMNANGRIFVTSKGLSILTFTR